MAGSGRKKRILNDLFYVLEWCVICHTRSTLFYDFKTCPFCKLRTWHDVSKLVFQNDYCAVIWGFCNMTNRDYLDIFSTHFHRRAASIIEWHKVSQSQVSRIFSWPSLQSRWDYLKCMLHVVF